MDSYWLQCFISGLVILIDEVDLVHSSRILAAAKSEEYFMGHPLLDLKNKAAVVIGGTAVSAGARPWTGAAGADVVPTGRRAEQVQARPTRSWRSGGDRSCRLAMSLTTLASSTLKSVCNEFGSVQIS